LGFGLGKHSPIVLSQSRVNFEAMLERHGQWLRWRVARKCPCVTANNRADIHCPKCGGSGDIYDYQREYEDVLRLTARNNIIALEDDYTDAVIIEVYNSVGRKFEFCRRDNFIQITDAKIPDNEYIDVRLRVPIVKKLESAVLSRVGGGYYRVPGITTAPSPLEGVYYQIAGDVLSIKELKEVTDEEEKPIKILGFRRDMIYTNSTAEKLFAKDIEYILPFRFVLLSQNLSKEDLRLLDMHRGSAVCTYPYMYNLSENDVITALSGAMIHKIVIDKRANGADDIIPEFFIAQVDGIETTSSVYKEGEDFDLVGTNTIHWKGGKPKDGEKMSITYRYYPTYRVAKEVPMMRTSEDQRMPRKVALALFSTFSEAKGVNKNG
jgi:hypothetical protein